MEPKQYHLLLAISLLVLLADCLLLGMLALVLMNWNHQILTNIQVTIQDMGHGHRYGHYARPIAEKISDCPGICIYPGMADWHQCPPGDGAAIAGV